MEKEKLTTLKSAFDAITHTDDDCHIEFWYARELQKVLGYTKWSNFIKVIEKAKEGCQTVTGQASNHFADVGKTIPMPKGAEKEILDIKLTRYACYLIAQNGDTSKDEIAFFNIINLKVIF